ncbi:MAG: hypothetical protein AB3X41_11850 [Leptothrix ochracea]|uniref:hypothetical protein n=1 Tax=Leptothrix ochracea TaxID=735331 RepID=UPI0034E211BC
MFQFLRQSKNVLLLRDADAFWKYCDETQRLRHTPKDRAEEEERLDLRAAQKIKMLLEEEVGPEEGTDPIQMQNWDWNDDRCRGVSILKKSFSSELVSKLQAVLVGEFEDFHIILTLCEDWNSEAWGHLKIGAYQVAVQRNVAQAYAIAA